MIERLSRYSYPQCPHMREIALPLSPRYMLLRKVHFPPRPPPPPPSFYPPLQRPQLSLLKLLTFPPPQPVENRLCFQIPVYLQHLFDLSPYSLERIFPRSISSRLKPRPWRLSLPPPFPRRLLIHPGLRRLPSQTFFTLRQFHKPPVLFARNHP